MVAGVPRHDALAHPCSAWVAGAVVALRVGLIWQYKSRQALTCRLFFELVGSLQNRNKLLIGISNKSSVAADFLLQNLLSVFCYNIKASFFLDFYIFERALKCFRMLSGSPPFDKINRS